MDAKQMKLRLSGRGKPAGWGSERNGNDSPEQVPQRILGHYYFAARPDARCKKQ